MQDPSHYLSDLVTNLPSTDDPTKPAIIDSDHLSVVNFECFYFASKEGKAKFDHDPCAHCGRVTDPVTYRKFVPTARSPRIEREGRTFFFRSDSTRAIFAARPDSFSLPHWGMMQMAAAME